MQKSSFQRKLIIEVEMWTRGINNFFLIDYHPLTDKEINLISIKDYSEELTVLSAGISRLIRIFTLLVDREMLLKSSFANYLDQVRSGELLFKNDLINIWKEGNPDGDLIQSIDIFTTMKTLIDNLTIKKDISFPTFLNVGKLINMEFRNNRFLSYMINRPIDAVVDKIDNKALRYVIRSVSNNFLKRSVAIFIAKFLRILKYMEFAKIFTDIPLEIKKYLIIFVLIYAEIKKIIDLMTKQYLYNEEVPADFIEMIDGFIFSISMDMKKIMKKELVGFLGNNQPSHLYMKIENSCGIMENAIKQTVVSIAQYFDKNIQGTDIFEDFQTKLEQSLILREEIYELYTISRNLINSSNQEKEEINIQPLINKLELFRRGSMKFLMFKDWYDFDNFYNELSHTVNQKALHLTLNKFAAFLATLLKEVNKRAVLYDFPFDKPIYE